MASTLTPRPPPATATNPHRRNLSHHNTLTDTPTPQSQSSSSLSHLMQSLNNKQTIPTHSSLNSRPLKPLSHHSTRLSNIANSIQHVEEIRPDDTELQRKEHEQSFERMMQELQDARISSSSEGESSSSRGGKRVTGQGKQRFRDEEGLAESDERTSDDYSDESPEDDEEDGSIRIGLSGVRYNNNNNNRTAPSSTLTRQPLDQLAQVAQQEEDEVDHDSDDLTYLTIPRSQIDQLSPVKQQQQKESPLRPTTTTTSTKPLPPPPSSNLFTSSPARRPPHPMSSAKENLPPSLPPPPHNGARPFLSSFSPRPQPLRTSPFTSTTAPLQSQTQPNYRSSPLNPLQNSPILANQKTASNSISTTTSHVPSPPPPVVVKRGGRPVTIEEVSDQGTPPRVNTFRRREESERNKSVRLPDMTFLTEALRSPVVVERKTTTRRTAESKGSGSTGSKEGELLCLVLYQFFYSSAHKETDGNCSGILYSSFDHRSSLDLDFQALPTRIPEPGVRTTS